MTEGECRELSSLSNVTAGVCLPQRNRATENRRESTVRDKFHKNVEIRISRPVRTSARGQSVKHNKKE